MQNTPSTALENLDQEMATLYSWLARTKMTTAATATPKMTNYDAEDKAHEDEMYRQCSQNPTHSFFCAYRSSKKVPPNKSIDDIDLFDGQNAVDLHIRTS